MEISEDSWCFSVLRGNELQPLRPEKSWRPIVTVEIDSRHRHEINLGCDGQNINQRNVFRFEDAKITSRRVEMKVWQRSHSKKKKKLNLVASASRTLDELFLRQHDEPKLEVKLTCEGTTSKRSVSSRGKGKNQRAANLHVKVVPPLSLREKLLARMRHLDSEPELVEDYSEDETSTKVSSAGPSSPVIEHFPPPIFIPNDPNHLIRGYLDSDEEDYAEENTLVDIEKPLLENDLKSREEQAVTFLDWIAASVVPAVLPQYTEKIPVPEELNRAERFLTTFTLYGDLREASYCCSIGKFESVHERMQKEWTYVGGILVAIAAVDTAVFAISSDSAFIVSEYAKSAIATSSIASGLGVASDAWFLIRYNWASTDTFVCRAKDLYGSYFFFALSSRVPALCMLSSAISLLGFLGLVAFEVWPTGVLVACFLVGVLLSMQFLVYGVHWVGGRVVSGGGKVVRKMTGKGEV